MSESELIIRIKKEDNDAFREIITSCYPSVLKYVVSRAGSEQDADDIMQETLIVLLKSLRADKFRGDSKLTTYVIGIARMLWLHTNSRRKKVTSFSVVSYKNMFSYDEDRITERELKEEQFQSMGSAMDKITEECRKMLQLYYYRKTKLKDIAAEMGYTYQFAKVKKNRCMNSLRGFIENTTKE